MLCAGDEYGRTQDGNNNAYCQDNPLSWLGWERDTKALRLEDFTQKLIRFRKEHPVFRQPNFPGTKNSRQRHQGHHVVQPGAAQR